MNVLSLEAEALSALADVLDVYHEEFIALENAATRRRFDRLTNSEADKLVTLRRVKAALVRAKYGS